MMTQERTFNFAYEIGVAGAILIDAACLPDIRKSVTPSMFSSEPCREVFEIACDLYDKNEPIDPNIILSKSKHLDHDFLIRAMDEAPLLRNAGLYAQLMAKEHLRGELMERLNTSVEELLYGQDPIEIATSVLHTVEAATQNELDNDIITASEGGMKLLEAIEKAKAGKKTFVPTGFKNLDTILRGGLIKDGLIVLAARPGCGKTTIATAIAERMLKRGVKILFISLEMSVEQLNARRVAAEIGKLSAAQVLNGDFDDVAWDEVVYATQEIANRPMNFNQKERLDVKEIQFLGKRDKPDMIIIDYLGLVKPGEGESRYEQVTNISNELKRMARSLRVPVLCLAQLNREVEGRKGGAPRLSDLRDSGAIEQDADVVMLLHKALDEVSEYEAMPLDVIIAKNRFGPLGKASMSWYMRSGRIVESR